ncbi:MAG: cellulose binding domain-containing protein, partial [Nakamurella sp.]
TAAVHASWQLQTSWPAGYVAQLVISAPSTAVTGWTVSWPDPHAISVANSWGMHCSQTASVVNCTGADWATTVPAGGSVTVGLQVSNDGIAPLAPVLATG